MTRNPPTLRKPILLIVVALAASGCGGGEQSAQTTAPRPTLQRTVAENLATRSDAIADALDAGDVCTAAVRADELRDATITAINNGQVPQEFQEDLQARANELVNAVNCPPPPTTTEKNEDENEGKGRGKKKGNNENGKDGSNEDNTVTNEGNTVTVPTESVPTVTEVIP